MTTLFQSIRRRLRSNEPAALATVVARNGSLPMSARAKMAVFRDGSIAGTIGGGRLEADVIRQAVDALPAAEARPSQTASLVSFTLTADAVQADGLTCGGSVEILLEYFPPGKPPPVLDVLSLMQARQRPAVSVAILPPSNDESPDAAFELRRLVLCHEGTVIGGTDDVDTDAAIVTRARSYLGQDYVGMQTVTDRAGTPLRLFLETLLPRPTAYLFGGGHIARHLARLLPMIDFDFVVIDDREEFANPQRFPDARACVVHDFPTVIPMLGLDPASAYLIIVTRGHHFDFDVLQQAVRLQPAYTGMIGSRRKIGIIFEKLRQQGVSQEDLDRVHAPIGLEIGADTPEEIAVSIAAQLIQVRRRS